MNDVIVTDAAGEKIKEIISDDGNLNLKLRVFVQGGGCSGFQYGFNLEEAPAEDDFVIEKNGIQLLIDPSSMMYLSGATIDFTENLMGSQFKISNPHSVATCGCGSSFSVG